jgi:hypothetical protein
MMRYMPDRRRRAPQRSGQRTTLRVPEDVMAAAVQLAEELGTTPNDAVIMLAQTGASVTQQRRVAERLARERRAAVGRVGFEDAISFPSEDELQAAMLSGRIAR